MGLPFKLNDAGATDNHPGAGALPGQIVQRAIDEGMMIPDVVREERVPDHLVGGPPGEDNVGTPLYAEEHPWPPAGPINDAGRLPMRLKD